MAQKFNPITGNFDLVVDTAEETKYDNSTSGLTATDTQAAVDEVEGRLDTAETSLSSHLDGGASKHDATEIDYERLDGNKKNIQASSDDLESATTDLDDAIGSLVQGTDYTASNAAIVSSHLVGIDAALGSLSSTINNFSWNTSALDKDTTAQPGSPTSGDRYLLGLDTAASIVTGAEWAGHDGEMAEFNGTTWDFTTATAGSYIALDDENDGIYLFGGTTWVKKFFEATTASGFLSKSGFDIQLTNVSDQNIIMGNGSNVATSVDLSSIGEINGTTAGGLVIKTNVIVNAQINSAAGIEFSKMESLTANRALVSSGTGEVSTSATTDTEIGFVSGVTSAIQTQLDAKLDDFSSVNDNRLTRTDGITGDSIQESLITVDDLGAMSGLTQLDVDNIQINGNTISSTDTNGNIETAPDGTGITKFNSPTQTTGTITNDLSTDAAAGANQTLTAPTTKNIRLTGALTSIDGIPAGNAGQELTIINATGATISFNNDTGATAANRILTGTKQKLNLKDEASLPLIYDGTEQRWMIAAGVNTDVSGSLDLFYNEDFSLTEASNLSSGNSATFDDSGILNGTLADDLVSPISGLNSITYTMSSSSTNDWFHTNAISIDEKQQSQFFSAVVYAKYDGDVDDIKALVWDDTNDSELTSVNINSSDSTRYVMTGFIPSTCSSLKVGFQVLVGNNTQVLEFDDIELSLNPFLANSSKQQQVFYSSHAGYGSTNTKIPRFTTLRESSGDDIVTVANDSTNGFSITANEECTVFATWWHNPNPQQDVGWSLNSTQLTTNLQLISEADRLGNTLVATGSIGESTVEVILQAGDVLRPHSGGTASSNAAKSGLRFVAKTKDSITVIENASALNSSIEVNTASGHGSTNSRIRRFTNTVKSVGSAITFSSDATNGASFTVNEPGIYHASYTDAHTGAANFAMGISKNSTQLTTSILSITQDDKKAVARPQNASVAPAATVAVTLVLEKGDVLRPHTDASPNTTDQAQMTVTKIGTSQITGVPLPRVGYIRDEKSAGTTGGTFTAGSWQTRDLNTLDGDSDFITLSSNQFTLPKGKYIIEASPIAASVNNHAAKLRNITDSTDDIIGPNMQTTTGTFVHSISPVIGTIEIASAKTFEIQHQCSTTNPGDGFGNAGNFGVTEIYTIVKITKLQ